MTLNVKTSATMNVILKVKTNGAAMNTMSSAECVTARVAHRSTASVPTHASRAGAW
ncbi:hypothetical protein [Sorangium cellulosum]|uniref:hypothetical protein n=1 Tax=Sorangium cellulosum TaxID=56 RepID=UPI000AD4CB41|nr:hypothetical protein [Sorangium cellulosum]